MATIQNLQRPIRASLIAPLIAGPAFSLSIVIFILVGIAFGSAFGTNKGPDKIIADIAGQTVLAGIFIGFTFAIPIGYLISVSFTVPFSALLDQMATRNVGWSRAIRWILSGALGGFLIGAFLWATIRPGNTFSESILVGSMLLVGSSYAGAATAWVRHRLAYRYT